MRGRRGQEIPPHAALLFDQYLYTAQKSGRRRRTNSLHLHFSPTTTMLLLLLLLLLPHFAGLLLQQQPLLSLFVFPFLPELLFLLLLLLLYHCHV